MTDNSKKDNCDDIEEGKGSKKSAFKSREYFVKEVAQTIIENHAKRNGSFIFGISGKWGEGKTTFLNDLKKEIESSDNCFIVRDSLSPWRFGSDKIAFLRTFLSEIHGDRSDQFDKRQLKEKFPEIYHNTDKTIIDTWKLIKFIAFGIIVAYLPVLLPLFDINIEQNVLEPIISIVFIIIVIPILLKTVIIQRSNQTISTLDQFDDVLNTILKDYKHKKILVFVDDLDRLTPSGARDILDNLRTFFDKKNLSFVVAGDHSVLESHLGRELLPESKKPDQQEEGRRFLKKIFNVYWRLPLPIDEEVQDFIKNEVYKEKKLKDIFSEEDLEILTKNLEQYFDKNPRQIKRFIEQIIFTFRIINARSKGSSDNNEILEELNSNPLLVVRILMIQELCAPLFEKIIEKNSLLYDLENAADKGNIAEINTILADVTKAGELSSSQQRFITDFLYKEPRFVEKRIVKVGSLIPFVHLAASASLSDDRGFSSTDDFINLLDGSPEELQDAITSNGIKKLKESAKAFTQKFKEVEVNDVIGKRDLIDKLVSALIGVSKDHPSHSIFAETLSTFDFDFYRQIGDQERTTSQLQLFRWVDIALLNNDKDDLLKTYSDKFPYINRLDFTQIKLSDKNPLGVLGSTIVTNWFNGFLNEDPNMALDTLITLLPNLNTKVVAKTINEDDLIERIITNADVTFKNKIIELFDSHLKSGTKKIKEKVLNQIKSLDQPFFNWASGQVNSYWSRKDLEMEVVQKLQENIEDEAEILRVMKFATSNTTEVIEELWKVLKTTKDDLLITLLSKIFQDNFFQPIAPSDKVAKIISGKVVDMIVSFEDVSVQTQKLEFLRKTNWLWTNLQEKPLSKRRFARIGRSDDEQAKAKLDEIINTWI